MQFAGFNRVKAVEDQTSLILSGLQTLGHSRYIDGEQVRGGSITPPVTPSLTKTIAATRITLPADVFPVATLGVAVSFTQSLAHTRLGDADDFGVPMIVPGSRTLTGTLAIDTDALGSAGVMTAIPPGAKTLLGTLYAPADAIGASAVAAAAATLLAQHYDDSNNAFGAAVISPVAMNQTVVPTVHTDADAFWGGFVLGTSSVQTVVATRYIEANDTFGSGQLGLSATVTGIRYDESTDTFGTATLAPQPRTVTGTLYVPVDTFGTAVVSPQPRTITGTLYAPVDTFGTAAVSYAGSTITGTLYANTPDTFGTAVIGRGPRTITGTLLNNSTDVFGTSTVALASGGGSALPTGRSAAKPTSGLTVSKTGQYANLTAFYAFNETTGTVANLADAGDSLTLSGAPARASDTIGRHVQPSNGTATSIVPTKTLGGLGLSTAGMTFFMRIEPVGFSDGTDRAVLGIPFSTSSWLNIDTYGEIYEWYDGTTYTEIGPRVLGNAVATLVVTYNAFTGEIRVLHNGALVQTMTAPAAFSTSRKLAIGYDGRENDQPMANKIYEVGVVAQMWSDAQAAAYDAAPLGALRV